MALPTGPIPRVAFEEYIEEAWGDSVAQSLNNLAEASTQKLWTPDGIYTAPNSYSSTGDLDVWFRVGGPTFEITVPVWATRAVVNVQLNGLSLTGVGDSSYDVQVQIGSTTGRRIRRTARQVNSLVNPDDREWFGLNWTDFLNVTDEVGDRAIRILAGLYRSWGTERRWVADNYSDVGVFVAFAAADAINFYPDL